MIKQAELREPSASLAELDYDPVRKLKKADVARLADGIGEMLPVMQTDITLSQSNTVLIIDAKYYGTTLQAQYDARTIHSNNLYQIFTYVKNKEFQMRNVPHNVSGMLLYARTDEENQPDNTYQMSGNRISVKTLDLNCDFSEIAAQLNRIAEEYFDLT